MIRTKAGRSGRRGALVARLVALFAIAASPVAAHDLWLEPARLDCAPGEVVAVSVRAGHAGDQQPWRAPAGRELKAMQHLAGAATPASLPVGADQIAVDCDRAGSRLVGFSTDNAQIKMTGAKFDAYVAEEGLAAAAAARGGAADGAASVNELYSRRAKTLILAASDEGDGDDGAATMIIGHTLEIALVERPGALRSGDPLRARVLFNGAALAGATLSLENLDIGALPRMRAQTDAEGVASFSVPKNGRWKLSTVWSLPRDGDGEATFETVFASYTFAFAPAR